jgi:hypothetical protein
MGHFSARTSAPQQMPTEQLPKGGTLRRLSLLRTLGQQVIPFPLFRRSADHFRDFGVFTAPAQRGVEQNHSPDRCGVPRATNQTLPQSQEKEFPMFRTNIVRAAIAVALLIVASAAAAPAAHAQPQDIRRVDRTLVEKTFTLGGQGNAYFDVPCPAGFIPDGVRSFTFHVRFTSAPENEVAHLNVYFSGGNGTTAGEVIRLTCVKFLPSSQ